MRLPMKVKMRPALTVIGGIKYAVAGSDRVKVPANTTMAEISRYMIYDKYTVTEEPRDRWKVEGSKGNIYTVTKVNNKLFCTCLGYGFRKKCKHTKKVSETLY